MSNVSSKVLMFCLCAIVMSACASLTRGDDAPTPPPDAPVIVNNFPDAGVPVPVDAPTCAPDAAVIPQDAGSCHHEGCECDADCPHGDVCRSNSCERRCDCDQGCEGYGERCREGTCRSGGDD